MSLIVVLATSAALTGCLFGKKEEAAAPAAEAPAAMEAAPAPTEAAPAEAAPTEAAPAAEGTSH